MAILPYKEGTNLFHLKFQEKFKIFEGGLPPHGLIQAAFMQNIESPYKWDKVTHKVQVNIRGFLILKMETMHSSETLVTI
jgi:hypothetical protein